MAPQDIIQAILKDSNYHLTLFTEDEINDLRAKIYEKTVRGKETAFVKCIVRDREIQLKPEEVVRQLYAAKLIKQYGYPEHRLACEHPVNFGREKKRADIVIFDKDHPDTEYIIVELKKPKLQDGKNQLRSYCNATGASIGVWTNGEQISHYNRIPPNYFEDITDIPNANQTLADILTGHFTLKSLILKDKIANERKSLKDIVLEMEDEVLANAGVDVFEEVFKLIFTKLYDEFLSRSDKEFLNRFVRQVTNTAIHEKFPGHLDGEDYDILKTAVEGVSDRDFRDMEFRNTGGTDTELKEKIQNLFDRAKSEWRGVFSEDETFELSDSHLSICVSSLQDIKLFNSNLLVVDEAFEYLVNKSAKGEKGQYFTPRHVIDMCVQMLNPQPGEYMIDTAAGSCGFPVHTIFKLTGHLFSNVEIPAEEKENVLKVFGIDFDEKTVRVARTLNLIAGDGEANVLHLNTLDFERWNERTERDRRWINTYGRGFERLEKLRAERGENKRFNFDILMANPPFAGDIKESRLLHQYQLGFRKNGSAQSKVGRDILFIERNFDFLKPGGRMAIVLPQGRFNNTSDKYIRDFIAERARILAVVGLHGNTFKPHTGTKTSVLFVQKWDDELCPKVDDYPIFFAVSEKGGKDNSGDYVFAQNSNGQYKLDKNGHLIVDHDLHSHEGELPDGIAETFIEWAKNEKLSFWTDVVKDGSKTERRKAWETFISNNRKREIHVDPEVDISRLCDEMNDMEKEFELGIGEGNPAKRTTQTGRIIRYSIVNYQSVGDASDSRRFDAEFSHPDYLKVQKQLEEISVHRLIDCQVKIQHPKEIKRNYVADGVLFLRAQNVRPLSIDLTTNPVYISEEDAEHLKDNALHYKDILITRTGANFGQCAIYLENGKAIASSHTFIVKSGNLNPFFLAVFFNTKYGRKLIDKGMYGGSQPEIAPYFLYQIPIPVWGDIQVEIEKTYLRSQDLIRLSKIKYTHAQTLLLSELGLANWQPKHQLTFVKNSSDTEQAERIDADYFHPKYEEIVTAIKSYSGGWDTLGNLVAIKKCVEVGSKEYLAEGIPFVRVSNLSPFEITEEKYISEALYAEIMEHQPEQGEILLSKDGTPGIAYYLCQQPEKMIPSGGILRLKNKTDRINNEYLTAVLNSILTEEQANRDVGGSLILHWRPDQVKAAVIPILPEEKQIQIQQKVVESCNLRTQSKHLLECAKRAVEIAIEEDEQTALDWLEQET